MTKNDIIASLARAKHIEKQIERVTHGRTEEGLDDLAQIVYIALLTTAEDKIIEMHEHGQLDYYIVRIIINQYTSKKSPFHQKIRKYRQHAVELNQFKEEI